MRTNLEPPSWIIGPQERRLAQAIRHRPTQFPGEFPKVVPVSPRPAGAEGGNVGPVPPTMASHGRPRSIDRSASEGSSPSSRIVQSRSSAQRSASPLPNAAGSGGTAPKHESRTILTRPESTREPVVEELVHIRPWALGPIVVCPNVAVNERDAVLQEVWDVSTSSAASWIPITGRKNILTSSDAPISRPS